MVQMIRTMVQHRSAGVKAKAVSTAESHIFLQYEMKG